MNSLLNQKAVPLFFFDRLVAFVSSHISLQSLTNQVYIFFPFLFYFLSCLGTGNGLRTLWCMYCKWLKSGDRRPRLVGIMSSRRRVVNFSLLRGLRPASSTSMSSVVLYIHQQWTFKVQYFPSSCHQAYPARLGVQHRGFLNGWGKYRIDTNRLA